MSQLNPAARSAQMEYDSLPMCLKKTITVKVVVGEHRGQRQYLAAQRVEGYKLVIDVGLRRHGSIIEEGETWTIQPRKVIGTIAFCYPERKLLTADGEHPVREELKRYVDQHSKVTIRWHPNNRIEKQLAGIEAVQVGEDEVIRLTFTDGSTYDLYHFGGKLINYGRFSARAYRKDNMRLDVTFWEK